jgi:outer membrane lipoprotein
MAETQLTMRREKDMRLAWILSRFALAGAVPVVLSGCARPVFKDAPAAIATPLDAAREPERYRRVDVVWGGKILDVRNGESETEIDVVAYPLDEAQRPDQNAPTQGRFVVELPGFVEPLDYPTGRFVTLRGLIAGTEMRRIDERDIVVPIVADATIHLWPVNFPYERPRVSFGVGVGVGIR